MLLCNCKECGGTEEPFFCENKLLEAQVYVARSQKRADFWIMATIIFFGGTALMWMVS